MQVVLGQQFTVVFEMVDKKNKDIERELSCACEIQRFSNLQGNLLLQIYSLEDFVPA